MREKASVERHSMFTVKLISFSKDTKVKTFQNTVIKLSFLVVLLDVSNVRSCSIGAACW